jgi:hypothetical protein
MVILTIGEFRAFGFDVIFVLYYEVVSETVPSL